MMNSTSEGRLRLTILGGFLGSGKTTWLRHQLHEKAFGHVHVIVNEAADAPVDDALLNAADDITLLAGACACCDGKQALQRVLLRLCDERSQTSESTERLETIVLETSGLADPAAIISLIQGHPILVRQIVITQIIVIVDAQGALEQIQQEALSRKQIEAADQLILTKTDIASPQHTARLRATLRVLAPGTAQSAASFGSTLALEEMAPDVQPLTLPELTDQTLVPIHASKLILGSNPDWTALTVWLSALLYARGDQIVRIKGVVGTPAGRLLLQTVRRTVQSPEILPDVDIDLETDNTIAVIGRGFTQDQLAASFAQFST